MCSYKSAERQDLSFTVQEIMHFCTHEGATLMRACVELWPLASVSKKDASKCDVITVLARK
jgi:hypothetical protein